MEGKEWRECNIRLRKKHKRKKIKGKVKQLEEDIETDWNGGNIERVERIRWRNI